MREYRTWYHGTDLDGGAPDAFIELTTVIWREDPNWVAECVEFGVSSFGSSDEEAFEELTDAVCAYLNTLEELGERARVFEQKGVAEYRIEPSGVYHVSVPREMLRREGAQIRPMSLPIHEREQTAAPV